MPTWRFPRAVERLLRRNLDDPDQPPVVELRTRGAQPQRRRIGHLEGRNRLTIEGAPACGFIFERSDFDDAVVSGDRAYLPLTLTDFHRGLQHVEEHDPSAEANLSPRQARRAAKKRKKDAAKAWAKEKVELHAEVERLQRLVNLHRGYEADESARGFGPGPVAPTRRDVMVKIPLGPDYASIYLVEVDEGPCLRVDLIEANHARPPEFRPAITEVQRLMLQAMKEERIEVRWLSHVNDYALSEEDRNPYRSEEDMQQGWAVEHQVRMGVFEPVS